mgnify:FL=1
MPEHYLQIVVAAGVFPAIFMSLKDSDPQVRRNTAIVVREVCKHTVELAQLVLSGGGGAAIVENVTDTCGSERLPSMISFLCKIPIITLSNNKY